MDLLILFGLAVAIWFFVKFKSTARSDAPPLSPPPSSTPPTVKPGSYRPTRRTGRATNVKFQNTTPSLGGTAADLDLKDLRDAFTGAPLDASLGLFRCTSCQVYYHTESLEVVRLENGGRCVACSATTIVAVTTGSATGRNFNPDVVTLDNFRHHFGRVVTFEGDVTTVRASRAGIDFAVMFEHKSWVTGFKLVFFRKAVRRVGGADFIMGLANRRVRVRGLLINHDTFGPEIIISERSMILSIK